MPQLRRAVRLLPSGSALAMTYYPQFGEADWGDLWNVDASARTEFATKPIDHSLTLASGYQAYEEAFRSIAFPDDVVTSNIYVGDLKRLPPPVLVDDRTHYLLFSITANGVLIADEFSFFNDRLLITGGLRSSRIEQENFNFAAATLCGRPLRIDDEDRWLPNFGVVAKPAAKISLYANDLEAVERGVIAPANAVNAGATPLVARINFQVLLAVDYYQSANFDTVPGAPRTLRATHTAEV
jgi:iron complex outermembrane receptor protein